MQIKTKEIRAGQYVGETLWICHYNRPDWIKRALRNVPPTKVIVVDNEELTGKSVYYSETHFRPISKTGKIMAKVISPVDNAGFRSWAGNELYVFNNEAECIAEWNAQCDRHVEKLDELISTAADHWKAQKEQLLSLKRGKE